MAAPPLLLRSRASIRAVSMTLRSSKNSMHERASSSRRRSCCAARLPPLSSSCCLVSMLPLHSAIASARLKSVLSAESQSWGWVPQGISMPL